MARRKKEGHEVKLGGHKGEKEKEDYARFSLSE